MARQLSIGALLMVLLIGCDTDLSTGASAESYSSVLALAEALQQEGLGCKDPDTALKGFPKVENTETATCTLVGDFADTDVTLWVHTEGETIADHLDGFVGVVGANWGIATGSQPKDQAAAIIDAIGGKVIPGD